MTSDNLGRVVDVMMVTGGMVMAAGDGSSAAMPRVVISSADRIGNVPYVRTGKIRYVTIRTVVM